MHRCNLREIQILSILFNGERFGRQIRWEYQKLSKTNMPIGSLYTTLDRMESKGVIKSRDGEPNPEYGGNRRRYYRLTVLGSRTLEETTRGLATQGGISNV